MNWLAHIFLSEQNIDFQIGNYLADPLKGRIWEDANSDIRNGMRVHKIIDSYTDSHIYFKQSKIRLGQKGLLKPVVIDLTYDYLLTKNWEKYCLTPINEFLNTFHEQAYKKLDNLPENASTSLERLIEHDILNKYQNLDHLYIAFQRVDRRLSQRLKKRDQAVSYFDRINEHIEDIENDFLNFFPQLCAEVRKNLNQNKIKHWKV